MTEFFKDNGAGVWIVIAICVLIARCFRLLMRHLNIRKHGWPPQHPNADGDINDSKEEAEVSKQFWNRGLDK